MGVMVSLHLFCLFVNQDYVEKTTQLIITKFGGNVAHGPRKTNGLRGQPDHVKLGSRSGSGTSVSVDL